MSAVLVFAYGPALYLVEEPGGPLERFEIAPAPGGAPARPNSDRGPARLPPELARAVRDREVVAGSAPVAAALSALLGRPVALAPSTDLASARRTLRPPDGPAERRYLLGVAHGDLENALHRPAEMLVVLAREEERLARAVGREDRAAEAFVAVPSSPLADYAERWAGARAGLERQRADLAAQVEALARSLVPNLSAVVGPRVAARLVAAAGGIPELGRLRASRLQLLGARRRPSPTRGPRYGLIVNAERIGDVPAPRRAAFARSLAALASIAARADATTRADLSNELVRRRDRRVEALRRGRR